MKTNPIAYLPIEYRSREFDGKLALAVALMRRGVTVVIGQQWAMYQNLRNFPTGVVLVKSQNLIHHAAMAMARQVGHLVLSLEEESMALTTAEAIGRNCPPTTYQHLDLLLATGELERAAHVAAGCPEGKIIVTGNPRIDLLKNEFRAFHDVDIANLNKRFGNFVLINTNFGIKNSKWGSVEAVRQIEIAAGSLNTSDPESVSRFETMVQWEELNSQGIFRIVSQIAAAFPQRAIVVRPHPSEHIPLVEQQYSHLQNVHVIHEGSHVPWTLAADILIHTSCTTGMEAAIGGKTAVSLVTDENWISKSFLTNLVNPVYRSVDALVADVKKHLAGEAQIPMPDLSAYQHIIQNITSVSSIDVISAVMATLMNSGADLSFTAIPDTPRGEWQISKCSISTEEICSLTDRVLAIPALASNAKPTIYKMGDSLFLMPALGAATKSQ